jgi:predicted ABC-type ATPase
MTGLQVASSSILTRYNRSIANGAVAMALVDRAYGYDNSVDDRDPKKLFLTKDGRVFKTYADLKLHEWGQMMIEELAKPARTAPEPG